MIPKDREWKNQCLKKQGVLNVSPEKIKDDFFKQNDFFDVHDLLQVKYEMVRRSRMEGWGVSRVSKAFGFSRPSVYEAQKIFEKEGLPGLIPKNRGPKTAHKISEKIMTFIQKNLHKQKDIRSTDIVVLIKKQFGVQVHPRSIERALERTKKK